MSRARDTANLGGTDLATQVELDAATTTTAADLTNVNSDILTLALKQAVQENSAKFNLPNSAITKFESSADYNAGSSTNITLDSAEFIHTPSGGSSQVLIPHGTGTDIPSQDLSTSNDDRLRNGDTTESKPNSYKTDSTGEYINYGVDWGSGVTRTITGFKVYGPTDDGIHTGGGANGYVRLTGSTTSITPAIANGTQLHQVTSQSFTSHGMVYSVLSGITTTTAYRYHFMFIKDVAAAGSIMYIGEHQWYHTVTALNATGEALGTTNVPSSAVTEVSGVMLLKHAYGANTLGTDVKVYFTANNSAWTEASSYTDAGTFSGTTKMIKLGRTTCTGGSDVRWKVAWANQVAGEKEAQIYGIGLNY